MNMCEDHVYRGVVKVWLGVAVATPSLASQAKPMVQKISLVGL